jgi:hypothetical protein
LTASFASGSGSLTGSFTSLTAYAVGGNNAGQTALGSINNIGVTGTIFGATYTGTATALTGAGTAFDITGTSGNLQGGFYGPGAVETAGVYQMGGNGVQIVGSFGALPTSSLFSIDANTALLQSGNYTTTIFGTPLAISQSGQTITVNATTAGGSLTAAYATTSVTTQTRDGVSATEYAGTVGASSDSVAPVGSTSKLNSYGAALGLQYTDFGTWNVANASTGTKEYSGVYAGAAQGSTLTAVMPTTGTASYSGGATGAVVQPGSTYGAATFYGNASMTATFGTGAISGSITGIQAYTSSNSTPVGTVNDISFTAAIAGNSFAGATAASTTAGAAFNTTGATGQIKGGFYGPNAAEAAGIFNLSGGTNTIGMIGAFGMKLQPAPSDRRLKQDVEPLGRLPNGLRLYGWRYLGGQRRFAGVMAQDLLADPRFAGAVVVDGDGLMRVDYAAIGLIPDDMAAMQREGEAAVALWRRQLH